MTFDDLLGLARLTLRNPAQAVRVLQSLDLPMAVRWMGLIVIVSLSSILASLAMRIFPVLTESSLNLPDLSPISRAGLQLGGMVLSAWLVAGIGRAFGGRGDFPDALLILVWLECLMLAVQALQIVVMLLFPLFGSMLGIAALLAMVWLSVQMVKELHGFRNAALVFLGMMGAGLLTLIVLSVLAGALGLMPDIPAEVPQ
ncbi:MAG TPA: Yip1 family protein [Paracoccus sp. (in: a-proteobacteria)]|uniref:Yip1 family protein n=1 Tax=uncultured Paracoccus sp. TaxID=189685 RepID=UPI0026219DB9|nr:Yip1 family protein [uncultured Paracoccus sp.]HMQ41927.1 Yip1 family protein [Paracoccus sp. (in: a-proteobacteria)]HMR37784.1 Yip1 family protein [Paracoccus sp. (in: a-proteobacteria)]